MTSQLVVIPAQMTSLSQRYQQVAAEIEAIERDLRHELGAVRLNAADPGFSPSNLSARASGATQALLIFAQQTDTEAGQIDDALRQAQTADSGGFDVVDFFIDYVLGDIGAFWQRNEDGFTLGSMTTGAIRVVRTGIYLNAPAAMKASKFPVFNTGFVGRTLAAGMQRVPGLTRAGGWLGSGAATTFFRRAGIVGAVAGTGIGMYDLYQQGNPIDAFEREGAGYVADVASTAFSASTVAFLIAPNPITGALVIGTGAVWLGAEIVDNWDDISSAASDAWDSGTDLLADGASNAIGAVGDSVDLLANGAGALADGAGDLIGGVGGLVSDWF